MLSDSSFDSNEGAVFLYLGSSSGITSVGFTDADTILTGDDGAGTGSSFGHFNSRGVGDLNGDGFDDIAAVSYDEDGVSGGSSYALTVRIWYGSSTGIASGTVLDADVTIEGADWSEGHEMSLVRLGDVNGDGFDDLGVAYGAGSLSLFSIGVADDAYIFHGSAAGITATEPADADMVIEECTNALSDVSIQSFTGADYPFEGVGDINGDGFDDVACLNEEDVDGSGTEVTVARFYHGSSSGITASDTTDYDGLIYTLGETTDDFGHTMEFVGIGGGTDVNGDGFDDVLLSQGQIISLLVLDESGGIDSSSTGDATAPIYLFLGSSSGMGEISQNEAEAIYEPDDSGFTRSYGHATRPGFAGDTDGDGYQEIWADWAYEQSDGSTFFGQAIYNVEMDPPDEDGDGFSVADDCDDTDADVNPDATELCDGIDNDCDDETDEDDAADALTWFADSDGDGFGDPDTSTAACEEPSGFTSDDTDCDDGDSTVSPDAIEVCDEVDNDCDDEIDEDDATDASTWFADSDGDGFGDASVTDVACDVPSGFVDDATDCDDADSTIHPTATETCGDGVDSDCDGSGGPTDDEDGDGLDFTTEEANGTDDCDDDSDDDGLTDFEEDTLGTDPLDSDTDGDGLDDATEAAGETDPLDEDTDDDGLVDGEDDAPTDDDADDDGLIDGEDPDTTDADTDDDGLTDGEEVNEHGTNPEESDTDGDGISDSEEIEDGTDPLDTGDDTDGDGLFDDAEVTLYGTDPELADTDGDGIDDGEEVESGMDPVFADADDDGIHSLVDCDDSDSSSATPWDDCPDPNDLVVDGRRVRMTGSTSHRAVFIVNGGIIDLEPHDSSSGLGGVLELEAEIVYLGESSGISSKGRGLSGGEPGEDGDGPGGGLAGSAGGGGGHAGVGMEGVEDCGGTEVALGNGGSVVDSSSSTDLLMGSGGGGGTTGGGATGGGAVFVVADVISIQGGISAKGSKPKDDIESRDGGSGAGGTIYIETEVITCGEDALLDVRGGSGLSRLLLDGSAPLPDGYGGAGAGGRLLINAELGNPEECIPDRGLRFSGGSGGCSDDTDTDGVFFVNGEEQ